MVGLLSMQTLVDISRLAPIQTAILNVSLWRPTGTSVAQSFEATRTQEMKEKESEASQKFQLALLGGCHDTID